MKKIGILFLGDSSGYGGGVHQYSQSILDALKYDKTNKYVLFCNEDDARFDFLDIEVRKINKPKTNVFQKIIRILQMLFLIRIPFFITNKEFKAFNDIELFLSPSISAYPHFYINKPFIFTLHDMQERYFPNFFTFYEKFVRWLNNHALSRASNAIICESNFVKNDIVKFTKVNQDKIYVIKSPPPEEFVKFRFVDIRFNEIKKKYRLPNKYLFYPAQSWFHKNHINLIKAFSLIADKYKDICLVFSGSRQNNYKNIMQEIELVGLKDRIMHIGFIDYDDIPYVYKMSEFLVMPTLFESVSMPIYEAFSLGVGVVSSNIVALPEQVGDCGILFNPFDINDIAEKISICLSDSSILNDCALRGLKKITNFNHDNYRAELLNLINKINV